VRVTVAGFDVLSQDALGWVAVLLAMFAPLGVRRYRSMSR
jgi:hypothetical protein